MAIYVKNASYHRHGHLNMHMFAKTINEAIQKRCESGIPYDDYTYAFIEDSSANCKNAIDECSNLMKNDIIPKYEDKMIISYSFFSINSFDNNPNLYSVKCKITFQPLPSE